MDTIASRYANALLELAIENNKVNEYQKEIKLVYSDGLEQGSRVLDLIEKISRGEIK